VLSESLPPPFFLIISERDEEVVEERKGLCEMSSGRREMPSRIGDDVHPTATPVLWRPWFSPFPASFSSHPPRRGLLHSSCVTVTMESGVGMGGTLQLLF
jgi:hypothetical protein